MSIVVGCAGLTFQEVRAETVRAVIEAALSAGVEEFDTARAYTLTQDDSHNESLLARVLGSRARVISKGGHFRTPTLPWGVDGRPETLRADCERSLRALNRESIDLYLLHWPDPDVDILESVGALDELRAAGKVTAIGVSNVSVSQFARVKQSYEIDAVQNQLSLFSNENLDLLGQCRREGVRFLAYSPLGGGRKAITRPHPALAQLAHDRGVSPAQMALAWLLDPSIGAEPVVGVTRVGSVLDSASAANIRLTSNELGCLEHAFG